MLTALESRALVRLGGVVSKSPLPSVAKALAAMDRDIKSCAPAIVALLEIKKRKLYVDTSATFGDYLLSAWSLTERWFSRLMTWLEISEANDLGPRGPKIGEYEARQINSEAKRTARANGTTKFEALTAALKKRKAEMEEEEAQLRIARVKLVRPAKDWREVCQTSIAKAAKACAGKCRPLELKLVEAQRALTDSREKKRAA